MDKTLAIATNTFREAIRNKIVYSIFVFAAAIIACSMFFGSVSMGDRNHVILDFALFGMTLSGAIVCISLGVSLLHKELHQKTIYNILSKPITRAEFVLGKHLGLSYTVIIILASMNLALLLFLSLIGSLDDTRILYGFYFAALEMVLLSSVVIFFSSLVVTTTLPGILAFGTFVAGHSIENFKDFSKHFAAPDSGFDKTINAISWVVPDLSLFNVNQEILYRLPITPSYTLYATLYAFAYSAVAVGLAIFIFQKREFR